MSENIPDFADQVRLALSVRPLLQTALAAEFEVAYSTVGRWATGTARPHPRLQAQIIEVITGVRR